MKKMNIVCIFAHPDDEAFGPSGIIAKWALKHNVYLICVTDGSNPNAGINDLKNVRSEELAKASKILGVKEIFFLNYTDGELRNNIYHKVAEDLKKKLDNLKPSTLLTFDMNGVSGHVDHMFVSAVTTYLFKKLDYVEQLYYWVAQKHISDHMKDYFIYCPDGCGDGEADHVEDVSGVWDKKIQAIKAHISQSHDGDFMLKMLNEMPKEELFFVVKK
jgi:N-acetylglucosamine malate deacetylase 2